MSDRNNIQHIFQGIVTSNRTDKSAIVNIVRYERHPVYGKYIKRTLKCHIHDENNECNEGDVVRIVQNKPISKTKTWKLVDIVEHARD